MNPRIFNQSNRDAEPDPERRYHQETYVSPGGKAFVVQHGNLAVYQWRPEYRIEAYDYGSPVRDMAILRAQPSRMLRAQYQIVPFDAERRRAEIEHLTTWRDRHEDTTVLLLHGPGGQGKTRLANHIAEVSSTARWLVLRATLNRSGIPGEELAASSPIPSGKSGIMLMVDYAERWPVTTLLSLIQDPALCRGQLPLRILLIARPAGTWWQSVSYRISNDLHMGTTNIGLLKLAQEPQEWSYILRTARDAFIDAYDLSDAISVDFPDAIENDEYPLVLAAHMGALALVDAAAHGEPAPFGDIAITEYLLGRERTYWMDLHEANPRRFSTDPIVIARTVFAATLTGPLDYEEGAGVLRRIEAVETGQPVARILADHAACYPPTDPAMVLEPLYPDRLGEDFIALSIPGHYITPQKNPNAIELADPWAEKASSRLINVDGEQLPIWPASAISVLVETSKRWAHVAEKQLYPIVREQPSIMLSASGSTLASFSDMPSVPIELLEEIEAILPEGRDSDLAIGRAVLAERLANFRLARTNDPVRRGEIYTKLGSALRSAGLHDKQVAATGEAVKCYRGLSRADPEGYMVAYAIALDAHSSALMMNGKVEASIENGSEAVAIYRRLYSIRPRIFGNEFARILTNLGNSLLRKHLVSEALELQQEAVRIRRAIGTAPGFEPTDVNTAGSLVQLSVTMLNHGRSEAALDLITEAVNIYRSALTSDEVALELGVVAHALEIRGRILTIRDMYSEALEPLQEAIDILRPLIVSNPAVHLGLLSQSLSELAVCLLKSDRIPEGIDALQEAVEIFPDELSPRVEFNFVAMLGNLGAALTAVDRADEAVVVLTDAVDKSRILAEQDPHARALLPFTLSSLSAALMRLNEREGALPIAQEAADLYQELARTARESYIESWRKARDTLATILESLGREEEASGIRSEEL